MAIPASVPRAPGDVERGDAEPHFALCIVNESVHLKCVLSCGAAVVTSRVQDLVRHDAPDLVSPPLRVILYSPNVVADDYPQYSWDATLEVDGVDCYIGAVQKRCVIIQKQLDKCPNPRAVRLRLNRVRLGTVRSCDSELLAARIVALMQDYRFNPRSGSLKLQAVADEAARRFRALHDGVIKEHLGSFRNFLMQHRESFSIFTYQPNEIRNRGLANVTEYDERVAIRKDVRESAPPMLPKGHPVEGAMIALLQQKLQKKDSTISDLLHDCSEVAKFRVAMSAAFSSLMHWLQRHRDVFSWSTDPQAPCVISLREHQAKLRKYIDYSTEEELRIEEQMQLAEGAAVDVIDGLLDDDAADDDDDDDGGGGDGGDDAVPAARAAPAPKPIFADEDGRWPGPDGLDDAARAQYHARAKVQLDLKLDMLLAEPKLVEMEHMVRYYRDETEHSGAVTMNNVRPAPPPIDEIDDPFYAE
jgi:hypothetical protein